MRGTNICITCSFYHRCVVDRWSASHLFSLLRTLAEHRRWRGSLKLAHVPPQGDVSPHLPLQPPPTATAGASCGSPPSTIFDVLDSFQSSAASLFSSIDGDTFGVVVEPEKTKKCGQIQSCSSLVLRQHCNSALVPHSSLNPEQDTDCC